VRAWSETTTGGKWHSAANWTGWSPPDAAGAVAGFRPAQAANVPVTLAKSATVGTLVLSGASGAGYRLAGERLALDAAGAIPTVTAETGAHEIAAPLALAARTVSVDTCDGASVAFIGDMSGTNVALRVNRGRLSGSGTVRLDGTTNGIEKLSAGCGRTVVRDLSFATTTDALRLGGGTLRYEGSDVCLPGLVLQGGNGRAGVLDVPEGRTVSISSMTANATAFIKVGGGDMKLAGRGTFALGAAASNRTTQANTYIRANGDAPISTFRKCNLSQGRIVQGTVGDPSDAPVATCSDFCVGVDSVEGEDCEYVMNNGILNASSVYVDYYHGVTRPCRGQFTLNGGAVTSKWVRLGQTGNGPMYARPAVVVNGGRWRVTGPFTLGYQKASPGATDCSVTINGGELDIGGTLLLGRAGANTGTVHLCGGVLRAENIVLSNGTGRVSFDGGTYAPYCTSEANRTLKGLTAAYIGAGGAMIDLSHAGGAYTITQPLLHDPTLTGTDGGLRITGGGTLVLASVHTYAGPTVLDGSTLDLNGRTAAFGRLEGMGSVRNGTVAVGDVLRPGGSGTAGTLRLDADATVTGIVEMELADRIVGTGTVDVTDATLLVTDLNGLQRWNLHLLIHSPGGVRGTFAETNVEGSGYEVLNTGTSLYLWNGSKSGGTTIFVR
jgi:autotransporter-associated beta strand protein